MIALRGNREKMLAEGGWDSAAARRYLQQLCADGSIDNSEYDLWQYASERRTRA